MKVQFNRHIKFGASPKVAGRDKLLSYPKGLHSGVPESLKDDKFFQIHLKAGELAIIGQDDAKAEPEHDEAPAQQSGGKSKR